MDIFVSAIACLLLYSSVLTIVGLGGMFSERGGIIALSLEGSMTIGAMTAGIVMRFWPAGVLPWLACIIVIIAAMLGGLIYSMLLAVASINFKANQTLAGTALNILSTAIAIVVIKVITQSPELPAGQSRLSFAAFYEYFSFSFPGMASIKFNWLAFVILAIVPIAWFILNKTRFGLRLRACGENPAAADSLGINVKLTRYFGVGISGLFAGLGGLTLILAGTEWEFAAGANGFGFLALAVLIFGQWKPILIFLGSLLFAAFKTIALVFPNIDVIAQLHISSYVYLMLPYIVCLIALIFTSKKNHAPKASGIPYDKDKR